MCIYYVIDFYLFKRELVKIRFSVVVPLVKVVRLLAHEVVRIWSASSLVRGPRVRVRVLVGAEQTWVCERLGGSNKMDNALAPRIHDGNSRPCIFMQWCEKKIGRGYSRLATPSKFWCTPLGTKTCSVVNSPHKLCNIYCSAYTGL